jgi:hypothetical protein
VATSVHCSNVSGQTAELRVLILGSFGDVEGTITQPIAHGRTLTFSTHNTLFAEIGLQTGAVSQGVLNVESTQSGVFCTAMIVSGPTLETSVALHMVRVNGHPGTVE